MYIHSLETGYTSNFRFLSFTKLAMYTPIISRMLDSCGSQGWAIHGYSYAAQVW